LPFGAFTLQAPPGLILFGFALRFALVFLGYAATQRTAIFMESRRHAQDLKAQREITERVEASRIQGLRLQLGREVTTCAQASRRWPTALLRALDRAMTNLIARYSFRPQTWHSVTLPEIQKPAAKYIKPGAAPDIDQEVRKKLGSLSGCTSGKTRGPLSLGTAATCLALP